MEEKILGKKSLLNLISELEKYESSNKDILSAYLTPGSSLIEKIPSEIRYETEKFLSKSALGVVCFYWNKNNLQLLIIPPFPVKDELYFDYKFRTEQIKSLLVRKYKLGIILLRAGEYAIGIFDGDKLIKSKCGKRFVRRKHRKGGFSQARFARGREVQIKQFFDEVYSMLRRFESYFPQLDFVLFGGTKLTIKKFLKRDNLIKKIKEKMLSKTLAVGEINKKALEKILIEVFKTKVIYL